MPRTESSSAVSQDYLDFYYLSSARALGPNVKMGQGHKLLDPTSTNSVVVNFVIKNILFSINFDAIHNKKKDKKKGVILSTTGDELWAVPTY